MIKFGDWAQSPFEFIYYFIQLFLFKNNLKIKINEKNN